MHTEKGVMMIEFYHDDAPNTVDNFIKLSEQGFYDGLAFHRVIPGFVIQGGCPDGAHEVNEGRAGHAGDEHHRQASRKGDQAQGAALRSAHFAGGVGLFHGRPLSAEGPTLSCPMRAG